MRALVLENGQLQLDTHHPVPTLQGDEVLLKVRQAGLCRTDLELVGGYMNFSGILGHEFVAEVVQGQPQWLGKRVVGDINVADGTCDFCRKGIPSQCRHRRTVGIDRYDGAFADYMRLTAANLHLVPDEVSDDEAVFAEPLAAALQVLEAVHISPRDRVILIGAGKLGLLTAQVVHLVGADLTVIARHERQKVLLDRWHIPTADDLASHSAQVVIDCTGSAEGFARALDLVEPRGTIILKSTYIGLPSADLTRIAVDEIKVVGSRCGPFEAALRLLQNQAVDVETLIDGRYSLSEGLTAFDKAAQKGVLKILLEMG